MTAAASPCGTCPYRRSTPPGIWDRTEYDNLRRQDAQPFGSVFGCHLKDGSLCRGYLADQKRRGVPGLRLRMSLMTNPEAAAALEAVDETDPDLYGSIEEMCAANEGCRFPAESAKARKLLRQKRSAQKGEQKKGRK